MNLIRGCLCQLGYPRLLGAGGGARTRTVTTFVSLSVSFSFAPLRTPARSGGGVLLPEQVAEDLVADPAVDHLGVVGLLAGELDRLLQLVDPLEQL